MLTLRPVVVPALHAIGSSAGRNRVSDRYQRVLKSALPGGSKAMSSSAVGLACLLFFALSRGVQDAFFGNVFQSVSFLLVGVLAFGASTLCFSVVAFLRQPRDLAKPFTSPAAFAGLNVTTAAARLGFFYGLKRLEPAVVATLYNGVGPLTVLGLGALGWTTAKRRPSAGEWFCYLGIAGTLAALVVVVLANRSGLSISNIVPQAAALAVVVAGGAMITIGHMIARWFNDTGVSSAAVMGTRFLLTLLLAATAELTVGEAAMRPSAGSLPFLAAVAFALITIPSFMLQLGIARTSPLAVNAMRSLAPVFVFVVQQVDGRLRFSGATLICVVSFCIFATGASVLRGWSEARGKDHEPSQRCLRRSASWDG